MSYMRFHRMLLAAVAAAALVLPASASAAQIVARSVTGAKLRVAGDGTALVTFTAGARRGHVLYWNAQNWTAQFHQDYSGGWGSKRADWKSFTNRCRPYTGEKLVWMIDACDAPDGSHWALQRWSRLWQNYGGRSAKAELYISHWTGDAGRLEIFTDWSYHGKHEHLWGHFLYHGKPVFGNKWTVAGVPLDKQGRNIYLDHRARDGKWHRTNSFLTHPNTAAFCYTFASHPGSDSSWNGQGTGSQYRATVIGPGVTPLVQVKFGPPGSYDEAKDAELNAQQAEMLGSDGRCKIN